MKKIKTLFLALMLFGVAAPVVDALAEVPPPTRKAKSYYDTETGEYFYDCLNEGTTCLV